MSPERWERVTDIFNRALDLPEEDRPALVEETCGSDAELRDQVLAILDQHKRAGTFLETQWLRPAIAERPRAFQPGDLISARYRVVRLLGQGGMGEVYEVEDQELGDVLALKTVRPDAASNKGSLARFRQEIQLARRVNHPNVCRVYDIARHPSGEHFITYFTMELLTGQTLSERIRGSGPFAPLEALPLICQMAHALSAAHQAGVIHRDFKSSNVILQRGDPERAAVVTDFGLARLNSQARDGSITETGLVIGTPAYMAPEQLIGEPLSPETDVYALGLVVYEMLTGRLPFKDDSVSNSALRRLRDRPEPPSLYAHGLEPRWEAAILRCLERDPVRRFHSPLQLADELSGTTREPPREASTVSAALKRARHPLLAAVIATGIAIGLASWGWLSNRRSEPPPEAKHWLDVGTNAIRDGVYWKATKALERALSIYPSMPLAHARLAEAWTELDSPDKARDEMLLATAPGQGESRLHGIDKLQFEAIHLTLTRDFPAAARKYEQIARALPRSEKHYGDVDLGGAYEKNAQPRKALDIYLQATSLAPASPAGFLRLGALYGKSAKAKEAAAALHVAGSLYQDQSDVEGETEVEYELARLSNKPADAKQLLQTALARASGSRNIYQRIRILLQLGVESAADGQIEEARRDASQAIYMARGNGVEVLAVRGLIDLGNTLFYSRENVKAEEYFQEALQTAKRYHADRQENAALLNLGSLYMTTNRPEDGLSKVLEAKRFFDSNGFRTESSRASSLIGRFKRDQDDFAGALKAFEEQLALANASEDSDRIAGALEEIGSVYLDQENYPRAVQSYEEALAIRRRLEGKLDIAYTEVNLAVALAALGQFKAAAALMNEEEQSGTGFSAPAERAEMLTMQGNFLGALSICQKLGSKLPEDEQTAVNLNRIMGLCRLRTGDTVNGLRLCERAFALAQKNAPSELPAAGLAFMEAQLKSGNANAALAGALAQIPQFEKAGQLSSLWRCLLWAAWAANNAGDHARAQALRARSAACLQQVRAAWGPENYNSYASRNDIGAALRSLERLGNTNH